MINNVTLVGRLTKDPDLRYTGTNTPVASFTLAVDRPYTNKESGESTADFLPIVVWRNQAESVKKNLKQGSLVGVVGRIQTRNYTDNEGIKHWVTEIQADSVQFLSPKNASNDVQQSTNDFAQSRQQNVEEDDERSNYKNAMYSDNNLPF